MGKAYLIVEGQGEVAAAGNLVQRLALDLGLSLQWGTPQRAKQLQHQSAIAKLCEQLRARSDCTHALFLRDEDDGCPAKTGPETAGWLREAKLPFPAAVVLAHKEYEAWFLPCIHLMAGRKLKDERGIERPGVVAGTTFEGDPEAIRGVKEWLTKRFPSGSTYKPTLDQLLLTRMLDFPTLRISRMPSFLPLENALRFLNSSGTGEVYPTPKGG